MRGEAERDGGRAQVAGDGDEQVGQCPVSPTADPPVVELGRIDVEPLGPGGVDPGAVVVLEEQPQAGAAVRQVEHQ